jgi:PIN domain nuclease of toxin-antitoxin system
LRLLLDTHVWIWSLITPEKIGRRAFSALSAEGTERFLSPVSVWELLVLIEKGRVQIDGEAQVWTREALDRGAFREATLNHEIALESRRLELPHDDPADRFLVATALVYDLTLVTADRRLIRSRACRVMSGG